MTCIIKHVQFAKYKYETSSLLKHCEVNSSQVKDQCTLKKIVQRRVVEMFICSKKKDSSKNSSNHNDPAGRYKLLNKNRKKIMLVTHNLNGKS